MSVSRNPSTVLRSDYPWTSTPLIASAPMAKVSKPPLAVAVSKAGGLGFIAAGYTSHKLDDSLGEAAKLLSEESDALAIGESGTSLLGKYRPCAVWLFAPPTGFHDLIPWIQQIREATSYATKIWVQIGSVADAILATELLQPSVLVVQGSDAGGHALARGASLISLVPEVHDKIREIQAQQQRVKHPIQLLAAGGISDGRGLAASVQLGAQGCVLGTRFLASPEALIADGYQREVLRASDGGCSTVRTTIYDKVRDIHGWPTCYDVRGLINQTYIDSVNGLSEEDNQGLYLDELEKGSERYGPKGRITTYAGTGVGLIKEVMPARDIVLSVRREANKLLGQMPYSSKL
ncbi:Aldolase-type TIM barrel [Fusarium oxysporum f. sp. vasinfectum]|nr:Aldolase-type TIM barrel [Fusarium oxysporum f. sp. vasinfectum]